MRKYFALLTVLFFAAIIMLNPFSASAHDPAGTANDPKLVRFVSPPANGSPTALLRFRSVAGGDAPGSPAPKAIRIETDANVAEPYSYAGVTVKNVKTLGKAVADVSRISFKTKGYLGAGAPRLSVYLSNGNVAFLSAFHCNADMSPTAWKRTRFFGAAPGCTIYTYGAAYSSDGVNSAWDNLVAGEGGGVTVDAIQLVQDEGPSLVYVDDLRFDGVLFAGPRLGAHTH